MLEPNSLIFCSVFLIFNYCSVLVPGKKFTPLGSGLPEALRKLTTWPTCQKASAIGPLMRFQKGYSVLLPAFSKTISRSSNVILGCFNNSLAVWIFFNVLSRNCRQENFLLAASSKRVVFLLTAFTNISVRPLICSSVSKQVLAPREGR